MIARPSLTPVARSWVLGDRAVLTADPAMAALFDAVESRLAPADMPVLVLGETGVGKELIAEALHHFSPRRDGPLVAVNCAALPEALVESELFGRERGAYSGADDARAGLFEAAHGGVLLLDEIGELPALAQAKLLRVLETRRVRPLGGTRERPADARVVAATHRALEDEVAAGRFRRDLYFRLKGAVLRVPPLRRRPADVALLAAHFLAEASARAGRPPPELTASARARLAAYAWPGNVRELASWCAHAASAADGRVEAAHVDDWVGRHDLDRKSSIPARASSLAPRALAEAAPLARPAFRPIADEIAELERARMTAALAASAGHRRRAAALISMPLRTFTAKLRLYGLGGDDPA